MDAQFFTLLRDFLSLKPVNALTYPSNKSSTDVQDFLLNHVLLNLHAIAYPPSSQYQKRFWKWAIEHLEEAARTLDESDAFEIDAQIYEHYLSLMHPTTPPSSNNGPCLLQELPPAQSYVTHFWDIRASSVKPSSSEATIDASNFHTITLLESRTTIESGTTGLRTWLASFVLAQYLILHPELVCSKRVLELGSGTGFLGIIAASLQSLQETPEIMGSTSSSTLWLTDIHEEVLQRCQNNVSLPCNLSSSHSNVKHMKLDWFDSLDSDGDGLRRLTTHLQDQIEPEIILGADLLFDPSLIHALVSTLKIALQPLNARKIALIALTKRKEETYALLQSEIEKASLYMQEISSGFEKTCFSDTFEANDSLTNVKLFAITLSPA
ncbi:hypothetical protein D9619_002810 [Psilocybe cf. subviscida]|uniref:FAM86 N-terminal domain-containing protein n=1 Tax=Psilocybe cf. subviscida TaxID=2480587 RepID=A0A8H5AWM1_9AGAR|nr:hypothetical protein D9619_002810 [Psilocybe cf. subviscida]